MRIIWICNLILPEFSEAFGVKKQKFGGWISGMFHSLVQEAEVMLGLCFPVYDWKRMKWGQAGGVSFYSFRSDMDAAVCSDFMREDFTRIYSDFQPDIIHIWGTEYAHARAAFEAGVRSGMSGRILTDIQGLVSVIARHYAAGLPDTVINRSPRSGKSIRSRVEEYVKRGRNEKYILERASVVCGRTDWDRICAGQISPDAWYVSCHRILREAFYNCSRRWRPESCVRHTIFVSQAVYPVKGFHYLLQALPLVLKVWPDTMVIVSGDHPGESSDADGENVYGTFLLEQINEKGLSEHIRFVGLLDEERMAEQYLSAHVFVSCSTIENNSNSVCEAMYLGVPVISSDTGGMSDIISHRQDGILYPYDAEYMLAGWICTIFADDRLAEKLSAGAAATAKERHDKNKIKKKMLQIYRQISEREEKEPLFSIIMPVYNNEKYFPYAVRSILEQEVCSLELIIIDDGSTDRTPLLADRMAALDARVRVIHQDNQWIYASFNRGTGLARGQYIYIVNSDDRLRPGALRLLARKVKEYHPDVIWTKVLMHVCDSGQKIVEYNKNGLDQMVCCEKYLGSRQEVRENWPFLIKSFLAQNQANLYKREIMQKHRFRNDVYGADMLFNIDVAEDIRTALILPEPVYDHLIYQREGMNASAGRYYPYEHSMFNEIYDRYLELFKSWNCPPVYREILASWRLRSLTTEIRALNAQDCPLTTDEKLKKVFTEFADPQVCACAVSPEQKEEAESRLLSGVRELLAADPLQEGDSMYFVHELLEALLRYEKNEEDYAKIEHAVRHPLNPAHAGQVFLTKLTGRDSCTDSITEGIV